MKWEKPYTKKTNYSDEDDFNNKSDFDSDLDFSSKLDFDSDFMSSNDLNFEKELTESDELDFEKALNSSKELDFEKELTESDNSNSKEETENNTKIDFDDKVRSTVEDVSSNLDRVIAYAKKFNATDIHIIVGSKPVVRINKILQDYVEEDVLNEETSKKMAYSLLDEKQIKILEDKGQVDFAFSKEQFGRYRANVFKQKGNYSIALRAIPLSIPEFDKLKLPPVMKKFSESYNGLFLVTGATGSGKSTTLASLISLINAQRKCHIITIEDPIEYIHNHKQSKVNQREVGQDTDSFSGALRAALREDPDVILVGEMRDPETISIALTAAETGHLVFSTLHTVGAAKTIDRIIDSFPAEKQNQISSQLATVLNGIVSQQLVPKAGGKGMIAACEVMIANSAIRNLIREGKPHQINSIIQTSVDLGMQSLEAALADYVLKGVISKEEALTRVRDEETFLRLVDVG